MENEEARREIIEGISVDANSQAASTVAEAKKAAEERIKAAERQAARIKAEAEEKTNTQIASIEREAATRQSAATRRLQLEMMEKTYQTVISRCAGKLREMVGSKEYERVLEDWITQAAVGLRSESAVVNCSAPEREAVAGILKKSEEKAGKALGYTVTLTLADGPPLSGQGVTVTSSDGRTAFNNQVESRIFRLQTDIRKLVHDRLFARK